MLKCIAIDDEPLALRQLKGYIEKIPYLELAATCNNALEAQQFLAAQHVDLIFVDINMPDLSGVEFVRSLVDRPMVIFTTAYSEYAVEGFKLDAVDYLLKPFSFADFSRSAGKANSLYELRHNQRAGVPEATPEALPKDKEYISVKADYKVSLVKISDIVYLESEGSTCGCTLPTARRSPRFSGSRTWRRHSRRICSCACTVPTSSTCVASKAMSAAACS